MSSKGILKTHEHKKTDWKEIRYVTLNIYLFQLLEYENKHVKTDVLWNLKNQLCFHFLQHPVQRKQVLLVSVSCAPSNNLASPAILCVQTGMLYKYGSLLGYRKDR